MSSRLRLRLGVDAAARHVEPHAIALAEAQGAPQIRRAVGRATKRKDAPTAGRTRGTITSPVAQSGPAPQMRAASSSEGCSWSKAAFAVAQHEERAPGGHGSSREATFSAPPAEAQERAVTRPVEVRSGRGPASTNAERRQVFPWTSSLRIGGA